LYNIYPSIVEHSSRNVAHSESILRGGNPSHCPGGKNPGKGDQSTSSSSDTDTETDVREAKGGKLAKKEIKRKAKLAAKVVEKVAKTEVGEHFGKLAANWTAIAVRQSMIASIRHCLKANHKREKKDGKRCGNKNVTFVSIDDATSQPMEGVTSGNDGMYPDASAPPVAVSVNNVPVYPPLPVLQTVPVYAGVPDNQSNTGGNGDSGEEQAVLDAIAAFRNMGFTPDEKLIREIRKEKGDIVAVFENMKK